ncbi:hypothetical protein KIPB_016830, partial [Kipferlia bialata]|eukprot:g16830.t1
MRLHLESGMPLNNILVPVTLDSLKCRGRLLPVVIRNDEDKKAFERDLAELHKYSAPKCADYYLQLIGYAEMGFLMADHAGAQTPSSSRLVSGTVRNSDLVDSVIHAC